jgi:DNA-binding response OmpR family regulator
LGGVNAVSLDPASDRRAADGARDVLIVGDLPLSRGLMRMVLSRLDYGVSCVATAEEASAALGRSSYALALVALQLPDMPGLAFARRLRCAIGRRMPVLLFGDAFEPETVLRQCREAGIDGYLEKPIAIGRLVATVRELTREAATVAGQGPAMSGLEAPVDLPHLRSFTEGDEQLEHELLALYLSTAEVYLAEMRRALDGRDDWRRPAHALKGASANIGAREVAALAQRAEREAPAPVPLAALDDALERVRAFFRSRAGSLTEAPGITRGDCHTSSALDRRNS